MPQSESNLVIARAHASNSQKMMDVMDESLKRAAEHRREREEVEARRREKEEREKRVEDYERREKDGAERLRQRNKVIAEAIAEREEEDHNEQGAPHNEQGGLNVQG